jgi:Ca2+-binding RTX toxin-like protein
MTIFNVHDFGAKGNGTTDDTMSIQKALDAAEAASGGTVVIPSGTYIVSGTRIAAEGALHVGANVKIVGASSGDTVIKLADHYDQKLTGIIRTVSGEVTTNVEISNLTIDGNRANNVGEIDGFFCGVTPGSTAKCSDITLSGVTIQNCSRYGFDPHEQTTNLTLTDCVARNNGDGFTIDYCSNVIIKDCKSYDNDRNGFSIATSSHDVIIKNCEAYGNTQNGLAVNKGSDDRVWIYNVDVSNCNFHDNSANGIEVQLSQGVTISTSAITGNGKNGISILGSNTVIVANNDIHNNSQANDGYYSGVNIDQYDDTLGTQGTFKVWASYANTIFGNMMSDTGAAETNYGVTAGPGNTYNNTVFANLITNTVRGEYHGIDAAHINGNFVITGGASNDLLAAGNGLNVIDGAGGSDTAVYASTIENYTIHKAANGTWAIIGPDSLDVVKNTETFSFGNVAFSNAMLDAYLGKMGIYGINNTGTSSSEYIFGSTGKDSLGGSSGSDTLVGGVSDDLYFVNGSDKIIERASGGTDTVNSSVAYTLDANVENLNLQGSALSGYGNDLANRLTGNDLANYLKGLDGNDILDGGKGADILIGGAGDDIYFVDDIGDVVTEYYINGTQGTDLVYSKVSYVLSLNVENLTLTGSGNLNGNGNTLTNILIGNAGNNTLDGGAGADTMSAGLGSDIYVVDNTGDTVFELKDAGTDTIWSSISYRLGTYVENLVLTGSGNVNAYGNDVANDMIGNVGANILDGGQGSDMLSGGKGNDTYYTDRSSDVVIEKGAEGIDTIVSSVSYTLSANVENISLRGSALNAVGNDLDNNIKGNELANSLRGNGGNDAIDGDSGADSMAGGDGNDAYIVDNWGDVISEYASSGRGGTDQVFSSVSYTLSINVENITLTGNNAIAATGNESVNTLIGNAAANILDGGLANDTLSGGGGQDTFAFRSGTGRDTITDFSSDDTINIHVAGVENWATLLTFAQENNGSTAFIFGSDSLVLIDVKTIELNSGDFLFV